MDLELEGKVALVTGGSRGIGASIVFCLAREGCDVAFNHWEDPEGAKETSIGVEALGRRCLAIETDVSDFADSERTVRRVANELGRLDILVCNAGLASDRAIWNMSEPQWDRVIDVNLKGCFNYCRAVAPILREQESGRIVAITSINGMRGRFGQSNYAASKGGMIALTKTLARELGASKVTVNAVAPGLVDTAMLEALPEEHRHQAENESVFGRVARCEDVADLVAFLCSSRASHITGEVIRVDGGQYI